MPARLKQRCLGDQAGPVDVPGVRPPDIGHRRQDLSSDSLPAADLVRCRVVRVFAEERRAALGLKRVLGFGSYETGWTWMHKLRRAMVRPDRDQLGGPGVAVEMDQSFVGGRSPGGKRARYETKAEVAIAVERHHPKGLGRVRVRQLTFPPRQDLTAFGAEVIAPGTVLYSDGTRPMPGSPSRSTSPMNPLSSYKHLTPHTPSYPPSTVSHRSSNDGSPARCTTANPWPISTTTSTSSPSGSTGAPATNEVCCSTGSFSRPSAPTPTPRRVRGARRTNALRGELELSGYAIRMFPTVAWVLYHQERGGYRHPNSL
jgi:hypothetical protein